MLPSSTLAPAFSSRFTSATSWRYTAHMSGVLPSGPRTFGAAPGAEGSPGGTATVAPCTPPLDAACPAPLDATRTAPLEAPETVLPLAPCPAPLLDAPCPIDAQPASATAAAARIPANGPISSGLLVRSAAFRRVATGCPIPSIRLHPREHPGAVADLLDRRADLLHHRDQDVRVRRVLREMQVLAALDAAALADDDLRDRILVVPVAVRHVAAEEDDGVVEHRAVALLHRLQALRELRHAGRVVGLDAHELLERLLLLAMMRQRMEGLGDVHHAVDAHRGLSGEAQRRHARLVRLPRERHHLELQVEQLREVIRRAERRMRQIAEGRGGHFQLLHSTLNLAYRVQIIAQGGAVARVELAPQARGRLPRVVEEAPLGLDDRAALLIGVSLPEQAVEDLARIALHRQGLRRIGIAGRATGLTAQLERRERRVLADVPRRELVCRGARVRLDVVVLWVHARQPRHLDDAVWI